MKLVFPECRQGKDPTEIWTTLSSLPTHRRHNAILKRKPIGNVSAGYLGKILACKGYSSDSFCGNLSKHGNIYA